MIKFTPGEKVIMGHLSKRSWNLYKHFLAYSPLMICPCKLKHDTVFQVEEHFSNGIVLCKTEDEANVTVIWAEDLESVYEKGDIIESDN